MGMSVLIVVTHLLGTGHLARALVLARAFTDAGDHVTVVSGGVPVPHFETSGIDVVQLPPIRSDGTNFTQLLGADNTSASDTLFSERQARLLDVFRNRSPDVLITELFPFGRRSLRDEFTALLDVANASPNRPRIFASVRDILAPPSKPAKAEYADSLVAEFYDGVLVHADPGVVRLDMSWPVTERLEGKLRYTGFVAPRLPAGDNGAAGKDSVIVSAGGGEVGDALFATALQVAAGDTSQWLLLVGGLDAKARAQTLRIHASPNTTVEPARPDFRNMLTRAKASISLGGYNTAMDVLQAGLPAVLVAFDDGAEVEQTLRCRALARLPQIETLQLSDVSGDRLQTALARVLNDPRQRSTRFNFDGAARTREICAQTGL